MELDNLVVFDGQVVTRPLKMGNLQFNKFKLYVDVDIVRGLRFFH